MADEVPAGECGKQATTRILADALELVEIVGPVGFESATKRM
jgi:hypothetical protein